MNLRSFYRFLLQLFSGGRILYSVPNELQRTVVLTFDDGPNPRYTPAILDILRRNQVSATFFVSGEHAEKYPELVQQLVAEGHQLANHGYYHKRPSDIGWRRYREGVLKTQQVIETCAGGVCSRYFRPPFGAVSIVSVLVLLAAGFKIVMWNHDSCDSFITDPQELLSESVKLLKNQRVILLMHDDYPQTVEMLPMLLPVLKANNWKVVALD